jgi:hypothetical protein
MEILYRASTACRVWGWSDGVSAEHLADLMDAIHNIPHLVQRWEGCDIDFLREAYLKPYEQKWSQRGGLALCKIFDDLVAGDPPDSVSWTNRQE